jgi:hypothetical protein
MQGKQTSRVVNNVMMVLDRFSNNGIDVISSKQMTKDHGSRIRHSCQSLTWKLSGKGFGSLGSLVASLIWID